MLNIDKSFLLRGEMSVYVLCSVVGSIYWLPSKKEIEKVWVFLTFDFIDTVPQMAIEPLINEKRFPSNKRNGER